MRGRAIKAFCAVLSLTVLLSGCTLMGKKNKLSISGTTIAGQVTGIHDKTVTLRLGFITESQSTSDANTDTTAEPTESPKATEPADASASPEPTASNTAVPPTVKSQPNAATTQKPTETQNPETTDNAAVGSTKEDGNTAGEDDSSEKGVTANVATFTLGNTVAALEINDESIFYKEDGTAAALSDLAEGSILEMKLDAKGVLTKVVIRSIPRLITSQGVKYLVANEYSADAELASETLPSTAKDENAVIIDNGAEVGFDTVTISRASTDSAGGAAAVNYGVGAALLTSEGKSYIRKGTINTDANGAAGIFTYGGGKSYAADTAVTTKQDASAGLSVAGGGKLSVFDMTVNTSGASAPAMASGLEGGKLVADGGLYTTNGTNSPAVSSTADFAVKGATLTANASGAASVEGENSLYIFDSALTGGMAAGEKGAPAWTVLVYQSGSGAAADARGTFKMVGGTLESKNGGLIYTTNTRSDILLSGVDITAAKNSDFLLRCTGNTGWGKAGENGAECTFTGSAQKMTGDVIWDSISTLDFYLTNGSTLTGAVKDDETAAGNKKGGGHCSMYISEDSTWVVTGDSTLTNLYCVGKIVDTDGNTVTIKNADGKRLVKGKSEFTITVESHETSADLSGALSVPQWKDYQVTRPNGM